MKNLFISMGDSISVRNFDGGLISHRELSADEVARLIETTRKSGADVRACFEFGSVPSKKKQQQFQELLVAFTNYTGVQLSADDFFIKSESDPEEYLPNFN